MILVLEGHKEFVAVPDQVAPFLPMNGPWERPHTYAGVTYPDLQVGREWGREWGWVGPGGKGSVCIAF